MQTSTERRTHEGGTGGIQAKALKDLPKNTMQRKNITSVIKTVAARKKTSEQR